MFRNICAINHATIIIYTRWSNVQRFKDTLKMVFFILFLAFMEDLIDWGGYLGDKIMGCKWQLMGFHYDDEYWALCREVRLN